jgi:hypothetical protein
VAALALTEWLRMYFPESLPWLTLLMMIGGLGWYFQSQRAAKKQAP